MDKIYELVKDDELFSLFRVKLPFLACYAVRPVDSLITFYFPRRSNAIDFTNQYPSRHLDGFWLSRKSISTSLEYVLKVNSYNGYRANFIES